MHYVDLHSHVLYGLDDGAVDVAASGALLAGLRGLGFAEICATPHQKKGQYFPALDQVRARFVDVQPVAAAAGLGLRLGAENMWDDVFFERWQGGVIPAYDDGPAFLFELQPSVLPVGLSDAVFKLAMAGRVPVMAHPERYHALQGDDALVDRLRGSCAFVLDLGAIAGAHGRMEAKTARRWIEEDRAHAVASDAHTLGDVKLAAEGIAWIKKRKGEGALRRLLVDAPRAILAGGLP